MVKFTRQLESQLIPEWKEAFVNYRMLKKYVKKIKLAILRSPPPSFLRSSPARFGSVLMEPIRNILASPLNPFNSPRNPSTPRDTEENLYRMQLIQTREVKDFFEQLEEELKKVDRFYLAEETEFCERAEVLRKQLQILLDLKKILEEHQRLSHEHHHSHGDSEDGGSIQLATLTDDSSLFSNNSVNQPVGDEIIAALERNGVSFVGPPRSKSRRGLKPVTTTMKIDIPPTDAAQTISAITSTIWEDVVNRHRREQSEGGDGGGISGDYINRRKIQSAEKMIRGAYLELYKGLNLLRSFSNLNMVAFTKIVKKFNKVTNQKNHREDDSYLQKVKRSHFISSDKVVRLEEEVESIFTKHFASNDRKTAMKFLRPQQPKDSHTITFLLGLFTGSFVALLCVYAVLAHLAGIFSSSNLRRGYIETMYPVFSMFAFLSLHIFLYGCNLYMWNATRINCNFIFEFSPTTALKDRDAFLMCTSIMTTVLGVMVIQLTLNSAGYYSTNHLSNGLPTFLLLLFILILICPLNILYRSTRYCFLRIMRNIIFSPFYKVVMADFFMADQLTSQIPLLRYLEFTLCYLVANWTSSDPYQTCTNNKQYKLFAYVISFLPYYWRAMQCVRRYIEEGHDLSHLANCGKYVSAMLAAAARWKYSSSPSTFWLAAVVIVSTTATSYQLYWDFVKDWGLFRLDSRNRFLRDELILPNNTVYYISIVSNFMLRLAWIETISGFSLGPIQSRLVDFLLASLEIIRRGHWNFYRLENEHLNNVGKFRAVKTVPLPFREMDSD